jgi:hypothetical protein
MMKRPSLNRDRKIDRKSSTNEPGELEIGLSTVIANSINAISTKVDAIIRDKYKALTDHNA